MIVSKSLESARAHLQSKRRFRSGFSLLELLLALGITVLVLAASYSTFRIGWLSYGRLDTQSLVYHTLRGSLYKLSKEVSAAFLFDSGSAQDTKPQAIALEGEKGRMSFVTLVTSRDKDGNTYVESAKIFYKFENKKLLRAVVKGRELLKADVKPVYETFLAHLSSFEFSYAPSPSLSSKGLVWKDEFSGKDEKDKGIFPFAVRMTLTQELKGLPSLTLTKSIALAS